MDFRKIPEMNLGQIRVTVRLLNGDGRLLPEGFALRGILRGLFLDEIHQPFLDAPLGLHRQVPIHVGSGCDKSASGKKLSLTFH